MVAAGLQRKACNLAPCLIRSASLLGVRVATPRQNRPWVENFARSGGPEAVSASPARRGLRARSSDGSAIWNRSVEPEHKEILGMSHATTSALNEVRSRLAPVACLPPSAGWNRMPHSRCSTRISNRRLLTGAENLSANLPGWRRGRDPWAARCSSMQATPKRPALWSSRETASRNSISKAPHAGN